MSGRPLYYVTSTVLKPGSAQATQILSMARAFGELLGDAFTLVSCNPEPALPFVPNVRWQQVRCLGRRRALRYVELALRAAMANGGFKGRDVYTRDVGIAALLDRLGARVVYEMHTEFRTRLGAMLFNRLRRRIRFVAISGALKQYMVQALGVEPSRVLVAPNGVFMERYEKLRAVPRGKLRDELGLPPDRFILMHTGSLYEGRGIELFEHVLRSVPEVYCVSVGGSEGERARWAEHYQGRSNIEFRARQPNDKLVQYQMAADALLFPMTKASPIWWCTSPLKLFEYLASGVPIVGSALGSSGEIIDGRNAVLFDPDDPDSLVRAVRRVIHDTRQAAECARRGLEQVRNEFTWQARAGSILTFIRS